MSEANEEQQEQEVEQPQDLPGRRLREAREAAGVSREEVAGQMRLNERLVKALEEDDYSTFPSATFVSGYLRSYARILGLPEEDFVKPVNESIEPPTLVSTIGSKAQVSSSDLPVKMVTYLLVIVVMVSVSMWWLSQREKSTTQQPDVAGDVVQSDGSVNLSLPQNDSGAEATPDTEPQPGTSTDSAESDSAGTDIAQAEEPAASTDSTPPAEQSEEAATEAPQAVAETDTVEQESATPPPLTADIPTSKLELRYQADSWTEVTDNAGRRLVYGLIKAGQDLTVRGEAPFRIFLGYAPGVMVYYNNDLFDHSAFQRRDVARFRVGRAEHNLPGSR